MLDRQAESHSETGCLILIVFALLVIDSVISLVIRVPFMLTVSPVNCGRLPFNNYLSICEHRNRILSIILLITFICVCVHIYTYARKQVWRREGSLTRAGHLHHVGWGCGPQDLRLGSLVLTTELSRWPWESSL